METQIVLFLVAIVATAINSTAGGGGLLTFPVLMTVLPPVIADATSAVALLPAYMTSTWAGRKHLPPVRHWFWLLLGPSLLGSLIGAFLLNWSGNRSFTALIPWLIRSFRAFTRPGRYGRNNRGPVRFASDWCGRPAFFCRNLWRIFWGRHWHPCNCRLRPDWPD